MPHTKKEARWVPQGQQEEKEAEYDKTRFVSKDAYDRYVRNMKKNFILEQAFKPKLGGEDHYVEMLKAEHLEKLAKKSEKAIISIVHEFYENLREHREYKVFFRGVWAPFNAKALCDYLVMPCIVDDDQYMQYLSTMTPKKYGEVISELAVHHLGDVVHLKETSTHLCFLLISFSVGSLNGMTSSAQEFYLLQCGKRRGCNSLAYS